VIITAMCAGATGAGTITLTTADPDSGGTWANMSCPANGIAGMAWQLATGPSTYSATWANTITGNTTAIITAYKAAVWRGAAVLAASSSAAATAAAAAPAALTASTGLTAAATIGRLPRWRRPRAHSRPSRPSP
jgi:hypothetical protein